MSSPPRDRPDACPGALQTHTAADGELARVRVPGGLLTAEQLRALAAAARELGDGHLEMTSRGNLQLRGLAVGTDLGDRLAAVGLLPSTTHERVRNVLASALTGRSAGGQLDVRPWVRALDAGLLADPALADLPGRFLVTLDDGRGDVVGLGGDVGLHPLAPDDVALTLAGADSGLRARAADAVGLVLTAARALLDELAAQGGHAWRITELTEGPARVTARLTDGVLRDFRRPNDGVLREERRFTGPVVELPSAPLVGPVGAAAQSDGRTALIGVVPLGRLAADQADLLARLAAEVQLTPWRSVVVPDLAEDVVDDAAVDLHRTGFVFDADSPWLQVTACAGRPGCAKSRADVRADAAAAVAAGRLPGDGARQHWAGCGRRCGRPAGALDVVATDDGYTIGAV